MLFASAGAFTICFFDFSLTFIFLRFAVLSARRVRQRRTLSLHDSLARGLVLLGHDYFFEMCITAVDLSAQPFEIP